LTNSNPSAICLANDASLSNGAGEDSTCRSWRSRLFGFGVGLAWVLNLGLLVAAIAWIFGDSRSLRSVEFVLYRLGLYEPPIATVVRAPSRLGLAVPTIELGLAVAAIALIISLVGLIVGPPHFRTTRAWLALTALLCGWLGLLVAWPEVYWKGQEIRIGHNLQPLEEIARRLHADWPTKEDEIAPLGAFLAYPLDSPSTLLLLGEAEIPGTPLRVSAIERSPQGVLNFQLSSDEHGAWLAWSPNGSPPQSFESGLQTYYRILRCRQLKPEWFLVRYRSSTAWMIND